MASRAKKLGYGVRGYGGSDSVPWVTDGLIALYIVDPSVPPTVNPTLADSGGQNWCLGSVVLSPAGTPARVSGPGFFDNERPGLWTTGGPVGFVDPNANDFDQCLASQEATFQAFVHPLGGVNAQYLAFLLSATNSEGGALYYDGGNQRYLFFQRWNNAGTPTNALLVSGTFAQATAGTDHMITLRTNVSRSILGTHDAEIVWNGVLHATGNYTHAPEASGAALRLAYPPAGSRFAGYLGVLGFYNRCLTAEEKAQNESAFPLLLGDRRVQTWVCIGDSTTKSSVSYRGHCQLLMQQTPNPSYNRLGLRLVAVGPYADSVSFPGGAYGGGYDNHFAVNGNNIQAMKARVPGYVGDTPGQAMIMAGTNNASGTLSDAINAYGELIDACRAMWGAQFPCNVITPGYGFTASGTNWSPDGWLGEFNAALPYFCDNAGCQFIDMYDPSGPTVWDGPGGDAADVVGHPTVAGGVTAGTIVAWNKGARP